MLEEDRQFLLRVARDAHEPGRTRGGREDAFGYPRSIPRSVRRLRATGGCVRSTISAAGIRGCVGCSRRHGRSFTPCRDRGGGGGALALAVPSVAPKRAPESRARDPVLIAAAQLGS